MSFIGFEDVTSAIDDDDSSFQSSSLQHLEFEDGSLPMVKKTGGSGRMSPVRARTMKEYEQQIAELQKENFSLKLRIYFLEERVRKDSDGTAGDIYNINIELQVEVESLKHELHEKQDLLKKASNALDCVTNQHRLELQQARQTTAESIRAQVRADVTAAENAVTELQRQLSERDQIIQGLRFELDNCGQKLNDALSINMMLNDQCHKMELLKNDLELQLVSALDDNALVGNEDDSKLQKLEIAVLEKEQLIEQLRCGLHAKEVIIRQLEEEKKECIEEAVEQYQMKLQELQEQLKKHSTGFLEAPLKADVFCQTVEMTASNLNADRSDDSAEPTRVLKQRISELQLELDEYRRRANEWTMEADRLNFELDHLKDGITAKDLALKELQITLNTERQINADRISQLNSELQALRNNLARQMDLHEHTIEQLLAVLKQRDMNIYQHLTVTPSSSQIPQQPLHPDTVPAESIDYLKAILATLQENARKLPPPTISSSVHKRNDVGDPASHNSVSAKATMVDAHTQTEAEFVTAAVNPKTRGYRKEMDGMGLHLQTNDVINTIDLPRTQDDVSTRGSSNIDLTNESHRLSVDKSTSGLSPFNSTEYLQMAETAVRRKVHFEDDETASSSTDRRRRTSDNVSIETVYSVGNIADVERPSSTTGDESEVALKLVQPVRTLKAQLLAVMNTMHSALATNPAELQKSVEAVCRDMERVLSSWEDSRCNVASNGEHWSPTAGRLWQQSPRATSFTSDHSESSRPDDSSSLQQQTLDSTWLGDQVEPSWLLSATMFDESSLIPDSQPLPKVEPTPLQPTVNEKPHELQTGVADDNRKSIDWPGTESGRSSSSLETVILGQRLSTLTDLSEPGTVAGSNTTSSSKASCAADDGIKTAVPDVLRQRGFSADEPQLRDQVRRLTDEIEILNGRLRQADSLVEHLKRHIALNNPQQHVTGGARGDSSPGLNPEVIVELAQEVSRLNGELDRLKAAASMPVAAAASTADHRPACEEGQASSSQRQVVAIKKRSCIPVRAVPPRALDSCGLGSSGNSSSGGDCLQDVGFVRAASVGVGEVGGTAGDGFAVRGDEPRTKRRSTSLGNIWQPSPSHSVADGRSRVPSSSSSRIPLPFASGLDAKDSGVDSVSDSSNGRLLENSHAPLPHHSLAAAVKTPISLHRLNVVDAANQTPLNLINDSNRKAFVELQDEVNRLKREIEQKELENSRLLELSRRDSTDLSFIGAAAAHRRQELLNDVPTTFSSSSGGGTALQPSSPSGMVTVSLDFLKRLVEAHQRDQNALQQRLADSHDTCNLLQTRLEELVGFLQELLAAVPPAGDGGDDLWRSQLSARLNETQTLLSDVSMSLAGHDDETFANVSNRLDMELSTLIDLDTSVAGQYNSQKLDSHLVGCREPITHQGEALAKNSSKNRAGDDLSDVQKVALQEELLELRLARTSLQDTVTALSQKLALCENQLTAADSKSSEFQKLVEIMKAKLSDRELELESLRRKADTVELSFVDCKAKLNETADKLQKSLLKCDDLVRVKREMENALVEQEKNLTLCEGRIQRLTEEKSAELERLNQSLTGKVAMISALEGERNELLSKVGQLEVIILQTRVELESAMTERMCKNAAATTDKDAQVAELKAIIRQNRSTAELLCKDLQKMNDEAIKKNDIIHQLTLTCRELRDRCADLENALLRLAEDKRFTSTIDSNGDVVANAAVSSLQSLVRMKGAVESGSQLTRENLSDREFRGQLPPGVSSDVGGTFDETRFADLLMEIRNLPQSDDEGRAVKALMLLKTQLLSVRQVSQTIRDCLNQFSTIDGTGSNAGGGDHLVVGDNQRNSVFGHLEDSLKKSELVQSQIEQFMVSLASREESSDAMRAERSNEVVDRCVNADELPSSGEHSVIELQLRKDQLQRCTNELTHTKQRSDEATALNQNLQLEMEFSKRVLNNKENQQGDSRTCNVISGQAVGSVKVAIVTETSFEQLQSDVEQCLLVVNKLLTGIESMTPPSVQSGDSAGVVTNMLQLVQQLNLIHVQHRQLVSSMTRTSLPVDTSAASAALTAENLLLKQKLESLKQRYVRAKHAMKLAQEQLEMNNKQKQQVLITRRFVGRSNDEAIIEQINKTRQVLAKSTQNLETYRAEQNVASAGKEAAARLTTEPSA